MGDESVIAQGIAEKHWRFHNWHCSIFLLLALIASIIFNDGLRYMLKAWNTDEYSHGILIPFIVAYLIWQQRSRLQQIPFQGSWWGVTMVLVGLLMAFVGELSTIYTIIQYGFLLLIAGMALAIMGWPAFKLIAIPLSLLLFMIPLPEFFYAALSSKLQLLSSAIGVEVIRLFHISVLLTGNVIDLGNYKLQVVEACSGLRYLFPLLTLGIIVAFFYRAALWKRIFVVSSTIPITILMNSFRIGLIGVTVEYWGSEMAEGLLHDFEGWVVFMACFAILFLEMWLLNKIGRERRPFRQVFGMELPSLPPILVKTHYRRLSAPIYGAGLALLIALVPSLLLPQRVEAIPTRQDFSHFPLTLDTWLGKRDAMEKIYIDMLKFNDYILADYSSENNGRVNLYVAYYDSQRKGQSVHSPSTCIPGGGWQIHGISQTLIPDVKLMGKLLKVNRVKIQYDEHKQLVYYWFQQRGRVITNEYLLKWYLFWDSLIRNRSDGSLVRLTTALHPGEDWQSADRRLVAFARVVTPRLTPFIPD